MKTKERKAKQQDQDSERRESTQATTRTEEKEVLRRLEERGKRSDSGKRETFSLRPLFFSVLEQKQTRAKLNRLENFTKAAI